MLGPTKIHQIVKVGFPCNSKHDLCFVLSKDDRNGSSNSMYNLCTVVEFSNTLKEGNMLTWNESSDFHVLSFNSTIQRHSKIEGK